MTPSNTCELCAANCCNIVVDVRPPPLCDELRWWWWWVCCCCCCWCSSWFCAAAACKNIRSNATIVNRFILSSEWLFLEIFKSIVICRGKLAEYKSFSIAAFFMDPKVVKCRRTRLTKHSGRQTDEVWQKLKSSLSIPQTIEICSNTCLVYVFLIQKTAQSFINVSVCWLYDRLTCIMVSSAFGVLSNPIWAAIMAGVNTCDRAKLFSCCCCCWVAVAVVVMPPRPTVFVCSFLILILPFVVVVVADEVVVVLADAVSTSASTDDTPLPND